ncbi:hypothetical protein GCM10027168_14430 [Streptomyces capparidis]
MTAAGAGITRPRSTLLVDTADADEAALAVELGLARGVTTNPSLLRAVTDKPLDQLAVLLGLPLTEVYYQPTGAYGRDLEAEAERAFRMAPGRVVVKAMATPEGTALARTLARRGIPVALTAAQAPQAMVVGMALGCRAVIPYHDRGLRDPDVSDTLVADLVAVRGTRPVPQVLAASVKSVEQVVEVLKLGADSVTAPVSVLRALTAHPSALAAEREFLARYGDWPGQADEQGGDRADPAPPGGPSPAGPPAPPGRTPAGLPRRATPAAPAPTAPQDPRVPADPRVPLARRDRPTPRPGSADPQPRDPA